MEENNDSIFVVLGLVFTYGIPFLLIALGFGVGKFRELRHLKSLHMREEATSHVLRCNLRQIPTSAMVPGGGLVCGQAVIATDYFKSFAASLRKLFGGEVKSYETLMERARREALLRMVAEAEALGANAVTNIRLETSMIVSSSNRQKASTAAEILAYGTALRF